MFIEIEHHPSCRMKHGTKHTHVHMCSDSDDKPFMFHFHNEDDKKFGVRGCQIEILYISQREGVSCVKASAVHR